MHTPRPLSASIQLSHLEDVHVAKPHFCQGPLSPFPGTQRSLGLFLLVIHLVTLLDPLDES